MWVESDCNIDATYHTLVGMEVEKFSLDMIKRFNKEFAGRAYATLLYTNSYMLCQAEYVLICKHWDGMDPSEDISPFDNSTDSEMYVRAFKQFCDLIG